MQRKSRRGGAGRYQCLVRSGGVSSPKFEADRRERKKRVVEKQRRSRRWKIHADSPQESSVYPIRRFTHDVSPFDGDEIPREKNFSKRGPRGVGSVALEKTIKNDSRDEKHERQDRLLNEINEKQRSAGGFNPL